MFPSTVPTMVPNASFAILCILGEILYKNVQGSTCINPFDNLYKKETPLFQNLLEILNQIHWTDVEANNTQRGKDQTFPWNKTLKFCFMTMCYDVNCSCNDAKTETCTDTNNCLKTSGTSLNCMLLNTTKNEQEKQCTTQKRAACLSDNVLSDSKFHPLPLTVAFILGTVFGCGIMIFTILFCRNRQSKKQIDSLEDIQLYSKFVGETPAYCEISESIQNGKELANAGAHTEEYMEPISKNTILQKTSKSIADQDENRENNAYFALRLGRRHADGDGYNHLKPNNGRIPTSPIHKGNVDSLYHSMASAESEIAQVDDNQAGNPVILEKHPMEDCCTQSSNAESKDIQEQSLQDERPYSMCIQVRDITITGNDDTCMEMQERNINTNTENTYFVLEKKIV